MGNQQTKQNFEVLAETLLSKDFFGYPIVNFSLMPPGTNIELIKEAMMQIVRQNKVINDVSTTFNSGAINCLGLPYMEILIPDSDGQYYVYSSTNVNNYLFCTDGESLDVNEPNAIVNDKRFYMWNTTIFNNAIEPSGRFTSQKEFKFANSTLTQIMDLKAKVTPSSGGAYTTSTIVRNTIYVYYPNSFLYMLVDMKKREIYVMQSGNNENTGTTPLTPENMIYTQQLIKDSLPEDFAFVTTQLNNKTTVCVVASPNNPAVLMTDSLGNSYQLADRYYASALYEYFKN